MLGCWLQRDPIGYADGMNSYYPYFIPSGNDPSGTTIKKCDCTCGLRADLHRTAMRSFDYNSSDRYFSPATLFTSSHKSCVSLCHQHYGNSKAIDCSHSTGSLLAADERQAAKCCKGNVCCEYALAGLMTQIVSVPRQHGNYKGDNKCSYWLKSFLTDYPEYQAFGPIGTDKISLAHGYIVLEPLQIPVINAKYGAEIVTKQGFVGFGRRSFSEHAVVKATIKDCVMYFDIGSQTDLGNFGGDDHWFLQNDKVFVTVMDLSAAVSFEPKDFN